MSTKGSLRQHRQKKSIKRIMVREDPMREPKSKAYDRHKRVSQRASLKNWDQWS